MAVFTIAEKFGKFAHEVEDELTTTDLSEYLAYFKIHNDDERKAMKKAQEQRKRSSPRRA